MIGYLFIDNEKVGEVNFKILAESMGAIGGDLTPNDNYKKYQSIIQEHYERNGNSNIHDFNFRIILDGIELKPEGGVSVTDSKESNEIFVDADCLDQITLAKLGSKFHR